MAKLPNPRVENQSGWGGVRPGAGRPEKAPGDPATAKTYRLRRSVIEKIAALSSALTKRSGKPHSLTDVVERAVEDLHDRLT
jgi:hypothetical protein